MNSANANKENNFFQWTCPNYYFRESRTRIELSDPIFGITNFGNSNISIEEIVKERQDKRLITEKREDEDLTDAFKLLFLNEKSSLS